MRGVESLRGLLNEALIGVVGIEGLILAGLVLIVDRQGVKFFDRVVSIC